MSNDAPWVMLKEGPWEVWRFPDGLRIIHNCTKYLYATAVPYDPGPRCDLCGECPPEPMKALVEFGNL